MMNLLKLALDAHGGSVPSRWPSSQSEIRRIDILRVKDRVFVEHWDVLQHEVSKADSKHGLPMFGTEFSY